MSNWQVSVNFSVIYFICPSVNICRSWRYAFSVLKACISLCFLFGIFSTTTKKKHQTLLTSLTAQQPISIYYHTHPPTITTQLTHPHTSQLIHNGKQKIRQSYYHLFAWGPSLPGNYHTFFFPHLYKAAFATRAVILWKFHFATNTRASFYLFSFWYLGWICTRSHFTCWYCHWYSCTGRRGSCRRKEGGQ